MRWIEMCVRYRCFPHGHASVCPVTGSAGKAASVWPRKNLRVGKIGYWKIIGNAGPGNKAASGKMQGRRIIKIGYAFQGDYWDKESPMPGTRGYRIGYTSVSQAYFFARKGAMNVRQRTSSYRTRTYAIDSDGSLRPACIF